MKPLLLAAALAVLAPAAAQAQVAAGTVPNTFDGPQPAVQAAPRTGAPAPSSPAHPASEELVRTVIADAQAGTMDYSLMTEGLADRIREQEATVTPIIKGFGEVVSMGFVGSEDGVDAYRVIFANAATEWLIGVNEEGKISALLFRPAE